MNPEPHKKLTIPEMHRLSVSDYKDAPKLPLIVVLDNVRSQHNVGAVFRTADAFRLEGIYLCGICCCPPNDEIHKTALGAELTVDWQYFKETTDAVQSLRERGYTVYAVEQAHNSMTLAALTQNHSGKLTDHGLAVVFGHEVFGVQQDVVNACDGCIEIPQYGTKHSLNVSVTAGIVMYELSNALRNIISRS